MCRAAGHGHAAPSKEISMLRQDGPNIVDSGATVLLASGPGRLDEHGKFHHRFSRQRGIVARRPAKAMGDVKYTLFFDRFLSTFFAEADAAYLHRWA
jgi:hypothetical protein